MVGESGGETEVESWVQDARRKSALDLLEQLANHSGINQRILVTPKLDGLEDAPITHHIRSQPGQIHVGNTLAKIIERYQLEKILYFGGGSAPLLEDSSLEILVAKLSSAKDGLFTNNQFASDWAGITPASIVTKWQDRLPQDNMIGWALSTEARLPIQAMHPSSSTRLDIDTPTDLLTLRLHPRQRPHLRQFLDRLQLDTSLIKKSLTVLATPASQVFIAGRISPGVWSALNKATSSWIRVMSEERGMVSSGRQKRGEVYSLLAEYISQIGIAGFFDTLPEYAQAAFIDTRVLLAHRRSWPLRSDRFLSDLGMADQVKDPWLREFTNAAQKSSIPIILGGHGLLSGDMLAFCEILSQSSVNQVVN